MKINKEWHLAKITLVIGLTITIFIIFGFIFLNKPSEEDFKAPGKDWNSPKKVENYFVEKLRMTPQEAKEIRNRSGTDGTVGLRINTNTTLDALISNLFYYGFIRNEKTFRYALAHTKDVTSGDRIIAVDNTRTIDVNAEYRISENMTAWQIADILLNRPSGHFSFDEYGYFFMP